MRMPFHFIESIRSTLVLALFFAPFLSLPAFAQQSCDGILTSTGYREDVSTALSERVFLQICTGKSVSTWPQEMMGAAIDILGLQDPSATDALNGDVRIGSTPFCERLRNQRSTFQLGLKLRPDASGIGAREQAARSVDSWVQCQTLRDRGLSVYTTILPSILILDLVGTREVEFSGLVYLSDLLDCTGKYLGPRRDAKQIKVDDETRADLGMAPFQITCKREGGPKYPALDMAIRSSVGAMSLQLPARDASVGEVSGEDMRSRVGKLEGEVARFTDVFKVVDGKIGIGLPSNKSPQSDLHISYTYDQVANYLQIPFISGSPPRDEDCGKFDQAGRILVWSSERPRRVGLYICTALVDDRGEFTGASKWQLLDASRP